MQNLYRYTRSDLELVPPDRLRAGDLLAMAGPPGSGLFRADLVTSVVATVGCDRKHCGQHCRIEYRTPWGQRYLVQPNWLPVRRLTDTAATRARAS
jgi:hypothetical protein